MASKKISSTITLQNPAAEMATSMEAFFRKIKTLLFSIFPTSRQDRIAQEKVEVSSRFSKFRFPRFDKRNAFKIILPILIVAIVAGVIFSAFGNSSNNQTSVLSAQDETGKTTKINKTFTFPLKDANGKESGTFTYILESAELRHQIVVKGQSASSVKGRVFLILNLKLINKLDQGLSINSRDYIRISVNGDEGEWFAPDIHNDPVEAQAISTKNTRLALAINESDKDIKLQIGEIGGKKTIIPVSFK